MRKVLCVLSLAAAAALTASTAQAARYYPYPAYPYANRDAAELGAGAVGGTVAGLGVSEGWWGATAAGATLPTTVAGAAALGGVAGIGVVAALDAVTEPCRGFAAIFGVNHGACENGHYVGYGPRVRYRRHG